MQANKILIWLLPLTPCYSPRVSREGDCPPSRECRWTDAVFSDALAPKVVVNGNAIINGVLKLIATLILDNLTASKPLFTDATKNVTAQNIDLFFGDYFVNFLPVSRGGTEATTAAGARTNLGVYSKAEVDALPAAKANARHTHGISLYSGTAGDPGQAHLVQGSTGIEQ